MTRLGLVIFARLDSVRLPGKALLPISGRPLLGYVIDRAKRVMGSHPVILATSNRKSDDPLAAFAQAEGIACYRGSAEDCLDRAAACCSHFGLEAMARICGDRPFHDPGMLTDAINLLADGVDIVTNCWPEKLAPPGMTVEIVRARALEMAASRTQDAEEREHLTRHFYRHSRDYCIRTQDPATPLPLELSFVVDTQEDFDKACFMIHRLGPNALEAGIPALIDLAREWDRSRAETRKEL